MWIELPVMYFKDHTKKKTETDLLCLESDKIWGFNRGEEDDKTVVRIDDLDQSSWVVNMPYTEFKDLMEEINGKTKSFVMSRLEL